MRNPVKVAELLKIALALTHPAAGSLDLDEADRQPMIENHQIRTTGKAEAEEAVFLPDGPGVEPFATDALPGEPVHDGLQGCRFLAGVGASSGPVPGWLVKPFGVGKK